LVAARKEGKFVYYRLSGADVAGLWVSMREVAQEHLVELRVALDQIASAPDKLASVSRKQFMDQAKRGEIVVIDVRPRAEFEQAHLPYARSMPLSEIEQRISELPTDVEIVAYCRGPFCLFSEEAAQLLKAKGRRVSKLLDGVAEWQSAGMSLAIE
jgi:rhodanese-related sulfurtransferase